MPDNNQEYGWLPNSPVHVWSATGGTSIEEQCPDFHVIEHPRDIDPELIQEYAYEPCWHFYQTKQEKRTKRKLFFGIELEVEMPIEAATSKAVQDKVVKRLRKLPNWLYFKYDSSLRFGVELVSHPLSWAWLMENKEKWLPVFDLVRAGFRSYDVGTCGMHIHLSKRAFGCYHLYKFMQFIYNRHNSSFILWMSQRIPKTLEQWAKRCYSNNTIKGWVFAGGSDYETHHAAVNLCRGFTVELRIFRGTLNPSSFWKNVEFTKALYDFSMNAPLEQMVHEDFMNWLLPQKKSYPNLWRFIVNQKPLFEEIITECV